MPLSPQALAVLQDLFFKDTPAPTSEESMLTVEVLKTLNQAFIDLGRIATALEEQVQIMKALR